MNEPSAGGSTPEYEHHTIRMTPAITKISNRYALRQRLMDVIRKNAKEKTRMSYMGVDLTRVYLDGCNLPSHNFTYAEGSLAFFRQSVMNKCNFDNCDFDSPFFLKTKLREATFRKATIVSGKFWRACLNKADFTGAYLYKCDFTEADLSYCDFTGATLVDCRFPKADMRGIKGYDPLTAAAPSPQPDPKPDATPDP